MGEKGEGSGGEWGREVGGMGEGSGGNGGGNWECGTPCPPPPIYMYKHECLFI